MQDLAFIANMAEIIGVVIVIGGLLFAMLQTRQFRQQRREMAAIELLRFFGSPSFADAYRAILQLPEGMSAEDIRGADLEKSAMLIGTTMENIGVMTFQRIVPFMVVNNLVGSSAVILWRKLERWIGALREEIGEPYAFEWFQWLADRLADDYGDDPRPAYIAHKDWKPARMTPEL
jgi:hypothetical protein